MTAYLGTFGSLVPVGYAEKASASSSRTTSFTDTLGGGRVAWRGPRVQRQWSFDSSASDPNDLANLQSFVDGEFGSGPFVWASEQAQVTNLLTPRDAAIEVAWSNSTRGGYQVLDSGVTAGRHVIVTDSAATTFSQSNDSPLGAVVAPVVPGLPVTLSAWLNTSGAAIRASFRDASGTVLDTLAAAATSGGWRRYSASIAAAPAGAAYVRLFMTGGGRMAKPCVTWTSDVVPYHAGQGCLEAIVSDFDQSPLTAWGTPTGQLMQASTTITEVGGL